MSFGQSTFRGDGHLCQIWTMRQEMLQSVRISLGDSAQ